MAKKKTASKTAAADAGEITINDLERYLELGERRKALSREAYELGKDEAALAADILRYVQTHGGPTRSLTKWGYRLAILVKRGTVSWKQAFIDRLGSSVARDLEKAAPTKDLLDVTRL